MSNLKKPVFEKPKVGGSFNVWGEKLNIIIDQQDNFNKNVVDDSNVIHEDLTRLENEKMTRTELNTAVKETSENYLKTDGYNILQNHYDTVIKPEFTEYVDGKETEVSTLIDNKVKNDVQPVIDAGITTADEKVELIKQTGTDNVTAVNSAKDSAITEINTTGTTNVNSVNSAKDSAITEINTTGTTNVNSVNSAKDSAISTIGTTADEKVELIKQTGTDNVTAVNSAKDSAITEINTTGTTNVNKITTHTDSEINRIKIDPIVNDLKTSIDKMEVTIKATDESGWVKFLSGKKSMGLISEFACIVVGGGSFWMNTIPMYTLTISNREYKNQEFFVAFHSIGETIDRLDKEIKIISIEENDIVDYWIYLPDYCYEIKLTNIVCLGFDLIYNPTRTSENPTINKEYKEFTSIKTWNESNFNPDTKENSFDKKSGFNLDKTDTLENDTNKLFTSKGALNLKKSLDKLQITFQQTENYDSWFNFVKLKKKPGNDSCGFACVITGGANYGRNEIPTYNLSISNRGNGGDGIPDNSIYFYNIGRDRGNVCKIIAVDEGEEIAYWLYLSPWSYQTVMSNIITGENATVLYNPTLITDDPTVSKTKKEFSPKKTWNQDNFNPDNKENSFDKKSGFNLNLGTQKNEVLEGSKLAEILGVEYGGIVNNSSAKVAGKAYYCTANKAIYKCIEKNSLNYIDAKFYQGLSNNKLLNKLENLHNYLIKQNCATLN